MKQKPSLYGLICDLIVLHSCIKFFNQQIITLRPNPISRLQILLASMAQKQIPVIPTSHAYHLNSTFQKLSGESLGEYVRDNFISNLPTGMGDYFLVTAEFLYQKSWPKEYNPQQAKYRIERELSLNRADRNIDGFTLDNVTLGRINDLPVCAKVLMDDDFSIVLYDMSAFQNWMKFLISDFHYAKVISLESNAIYDESPIGTVFAPCVHAKQESIHHLQGLTFLNEEEKTLGYIVGSKMKASLGLSHLGVQASAKSEALLYSLKSSIGPKGNSENILHIKTGLVVDILFQKNLLFRGFIPQSEF